MLVEYPIVAALVLLLCLPPLCMTELLAEMASSREHAPDLPRLSANSFKAMERTDIGNRHMLDPFPHFPCTLPSLDVLQQNN